MHAQYVSTYMYMLHARNGYIPGVYNPYTRLHDTPWVYAYIGYMPLLYISLRHTFPGSKLLSVHTPQTKTQTGTIIGF